ncbi:Sensory transduction protein containing HD_GYP domain [hydrothermal vent metagenome]|uniref:Sensory transduction protein containing HD_GYP domain n=1 Tax=hydrothermal vent metagenome TaxID=652676 RepID=A0A1W1C2X6_9ZZZZ
MVNLTKFGTISLLSVEDDSFNQELASAIFLEYPMVTVLQASQGIEAIEILKMYKIDIILLDLIMPQMDGFATLKYIKEHDEYKDIPVIVVTSEENERKTTYRLGANDFISKPYNPMELKLRVFNNLQIKSFFELMEEIKDDVENEGVISEGHLLHLQEALRIADNSQKQLLSKLGNISHSNAHKDEQASERLGAYARLLAQIYGLNNKEIDNLFYAMAIYDIGLLRIPKKKLKNLELKAYEQHPELGLKVLESLEETNLIIMAKDITIAHHENWDGSGYPKGLKGEEISLYARITALVDLFDELTAKRIYDKDSMGVNDALNVIKREKGIKLDPTLVEMFSENFSQFKEIKYKFS